MMDVFSGQSEDNLIGTLCDIINILLQVMEISQLVRIKSRESDNGTFSFSAVWCIFIALKCVSRDQILGQGRLKSLYVGRRGRSRR